MDMTTNDITLGRSLHSDALYGPSTVESELGPLHRRPGVVPQNKLGFSHFNGRVRVKKLVQNRKASISDRVRRLRIGSWNIGSLTTRSLEIVDTMRRRKVDILCVQETKWAGRKAAVVNGYKLWYAGGNRKEMELVFL